MSNLTYNPNINSSYNNTSYNNTPYNNTPYNNTSYNNNSYKEYNSGMNMEFNEDNGNFKSYDNYDNTPPMLQQMDPRSAPEIETMRQPIRRQPFSQQQNNNYMDLPPNMKRKKVKKNYYNSEYNNEPILDNFSDIKTSKFNWILFAKKIVIYTALFLIMSHVKMDDLVCKFIPFLNNNEILCMTFKGLLLAVIIILIQTLL
jgi:hypothetical protein